MKFPFKRSFWAQDPPQTVASVVPAALRVDVAIAGGGYAGMSAAYYLKKAAPHLDVAILEAEYAGFGGSGRNFGGVSPGVREVRGMMTDPGDMDELRFVTRYYLAQRLELERRIAEAKVDCEYREEHVLEQALDVAAWEGLQRQSEFLTDRGTPHRLLNAAEMRAAVPVPYETKGGLARTAWRAAHPFKLARGFRKQLLALGVRFFEGTRVAAIARATGGGVELTVQNGEVVQARKAVMAMNAYSERLPQLKGIIFPRHSYIIGTEVLAPDTYASLGFKDYKFVQDAGFIFHYARVYQGRLLFGGGTGNKGFFAASTMDTAADEDTEEYERVYAEMIRRWPSLRGAGLEAAWGGAVDQSPGFVPIVKELENFPEVVVNLGFSGEGIVPANCSGKMVVGLVLGREHQDVEAEQVRQILLRQGKVT